MNEWEWDWERPPTAYSRRHKSYFCSIMRTSRSQFTRGNALQRHASAADPASLISDERIYLSSATTYHFQRIFPFFALSTILWMLYHLQQKDLFPEAYSGHSIKNIFRWQLIILKWNWAFSSFLHPSSFVCYRYRLNLKCIPWIVFKNLILEWRWMTELHSFTTSSLCSCFSDLEADLSKQITNYSRFPI